MYPKKLDLNKEEKIGGLEKVTMPEKVCYNQAIDQFTKEIKKRAEVERLVKELKKLLDLAKIKPKWLNEQYILCCDWIFTVKRKGAKKPPFTKEIRFSSGKALEYIAKAISKEFTKGL
jgi:hypothetical protein